MWMQKQQVNPNTGPKPEPAKPRPLAAALVVALSWGAVAGALEPSVSGPNGPGLASAPVSEEESIDRARAGLAEAAALKKAAYKLSGDAREAALLDAAAAYGAVADDASLAAEGRAEAAFRAGEILRARKRTDEARSRFAQAVDIGPATFAARGLLELAHLDRRGDAVTESLARYAEVERRFPEERRTCAHARTWTGKLLLDEGRVDEAEPVLLGFAEDFPEYPGEAVRNADLIAVRRHQDGHEDAARRILGEIRARMEARLEGEDPDAEEIRGALEALRVTVLLSEV